MNAESFETSGPFNEVMALHETKGPKWEELQKECPSLPRGWFELSRLSREDRLEFSREFWLSKLPLFSSNVEKHIEDFFEGLEDLGIYLTQEKRGGSFEAHMVYSLKEDAGFFQGLAPANENALSTLEKQFSLFTLPPDYIAFLKIHDGFSKYTDTGLIKTKDMAKTYQRFQEFFLDEVLASPDGQIINPIRLIPFYESFGLHCYQCFYADWYPENEMGNVYFSQFDHTISNFLDSKVLEENLAFPNFMSWLIFYLEDLWHVSS